MTRWPEVVIFDCDGVLVDSETIALARTRLRSRAWPKWTKRRCASASSD